MTAVRRHPAREFRARAGASQFTRELVSLPPGSGFRVLTWEDNLQEVQWAQSRGKRARIEGEGNHWHYHEAVELTLFTRGSGLSFVGDKIQRFEAGHVVLVGENLPHYWHADGRSSGIAVQFQFAPSHPFWAFPESASVSSHLSAAQSGIRYSGRTAARLSELMTMLADTDGLERLSVLLRILAIVSTGPDSEKEFLSSRRFALSGSSDQQGAMRAAMRFLLLHYQDDITLSQLLAVTHMSKATFSRYFRKHAGKTLREFLQQVRVEAACRELIETDKSVIEIALSSGFSQISFFNRVFRRLLRSTPSAYRKKQRRRRAST